MANPAMPTVPEVRYEELTGEQLAVDVAALSGLTVEEVRSDGAQASLVALHLTGDLPETRQDLIRLATGESFVRPTAFTRVTAAPGMNVLTMDVEIGDDSSDDSPLHTLGIRPSPKTAPAPVPNADQTASAGIPPTVPIPGTLNPEIGRNDFPVESLHLMTETLTTHRFSRNGPVNREVSATLSRMDFGKDVTKVGLAEAVYRREWNDEWAPILSLLVPGTRSGGLSGCRFEHPDEHSNGPMSSLRLRMNSLGINVVQNGPNECIENENVVHDLVNVHDWIMLPASVGEKFFRNGTIDLSKFPSHQLNGSFCAL
eukprot:s1279_g15.t1